MAINPALDYKMLPHALDLRSSLHLNYSQVQLRRILGPHNIMFYILCPSQYSEDMSPWFVCVQSATTVLLVYRSGWGTMMEIARGLLELCIPFRTVIKPATPPPLYNWREKGTGLGLQPVGYTVTMSDYHGYKERHNEILFSSLGHAVRMCGGLVGRIVSELVPEAQILNGPLVGDKIVVQHGHTYFVDNGVTDDILNRVCGVYHVSSDGVSETVTHALWWPKHTIFMGSGQWMDTHPTCNSDVVVCDICTLRNMRFQEPHISESTHLTCNSDGMVCGVCTLWNMRFQEPHISQSTHHTCNSDGVVCGICT
jgi:hypothetical protein